MNSTENRKTININFCGFWGSFNKEDNFFYRVLSRHFNVNISDNPDFVICSNRGDPFEYMKYDCVRIMFMGENLSPDFTVFDYVIGFDFIDFADRYFRLPFAFYFDDFKPWKPEKLTETEARRILEGKKYFCNFIYGHPSGNGVREKLFEELSEYKDVISPGSYLRNMGSGSKRCSWKEKKEYVELSKFTIACDSICYPGFVTEKIVDPFIRHSIPVYFGSTEICKDFNKNAFILVEDPDNLDSLIEKVKYLDTHDDEYIKMLMECPLNDENYVVDKYRDIEQFLINIFSQSPDNAFRRIKHFCAQNHENYLKAYYDSYKKTPEFIRRIKKML